MIIRNWIPASAGMTVCEAHGQSGNTVAVTTLLYPNPVIPAQAGIQVGVSFGGIPADSLRG